MLGYKKYLIERGARWRTRDDGVSVAIGVSSRSTTDFGTDTQGVGCVVTATRKRPRAKFHGAAKLHRREGEAPPRRHNQRRDEVSSRADHAGNRFDQSRALSPVLDQR